MIPIAELRIRAGVALFNDEEELIGAMIRGDTFRPVNPGRTELLGRRRQG